MAGGAPAPRARGAAYADISRMRQLPHDDGVETALAVRELDEQDETGEDG